MTDGDVSGQLLGEGVGVEHLGDQSHTPVRVQLLAIARDDAARLLAAMLERVEPIESQLRSLLVPIHTDDAALFVQTIIVQQAATTTPQISGSWDHVAST